MATLVGDDEDDIHLVGGGAQRSEPLVVSAVRRTVVCLAECSWPDRLSEIAELLKRVESRQSSEEDCASVSGKRGRQKRAAEGQLSNPILCIYFPIISAASQHCRDGSLSRSTGQDGRMDSFKRIQEAL